MELKMNKLVDFIIKFSTFIVSFIIGMAIIIWSILAIIVILIAILAIIAFPFVLLFYLW